MKLNRVMLQLVSDIEYEIGKNCYNGNSYDGWHETFGQSFRYPVSYEIKTESGTEKHKTRYRLSAMQDISNENLGTVCYKFGSNELLIGNAIVNVLKMLEKRYGIDFYQLEKNRELEKK